uniref:S100/CaBP-9k-type calcium binding subdomain domain-containing protein n=1 Tax=Gasterosteus aculeatus aculeatus TaxID=481459 RepID=A0AAQ4R5T7_GASAC
MPSNMFGGEKVKPLAPRTRLIMGCSCVDNWNQHPNHTLKPMTAGCFFFFSHYLSKGIKILLPIPSHLLLCLYRFLYSTPIYAATMTQLETAMAMLMKTFDTYAAGEGSEDTLSKAEVKTLLEKELPGLLKSAKNPGEVDKLFKGLDFNGDSEVHSKRSSVELTPTELISTLFESLYSSTLSRVKLTLSK